MMENNVVNSVVEALILSSPEPLAARKIVEVVEDVTPNQVSKTVAELNNRYMEAGAAFRIRELAGGYQFYVVPEFAGYVQELFTRRRTMRLTRASLETLAITAYRQPVTKAEIEHIRGVASDGVIHNLLEKNLIAIRGRAKTVGKPLQYGTTSEFLKFFGLAKLSDLPKMSEIEELIKAKEPPGQTELPLSAWGETDQVSQKLNIADGTYIADTEDDDDASGPMDSTPITVATDEDDLSPTPSSESVESDAQEWPQVESGSPSETVREPVPVTGELGELESESGVVFDVESADDSDR